MSRKTILRTAAIVAIAIGCGLVARALLPEQFSTAEAGFLVGILAAFAVGGVGYGVWEARRIERRRKAKEQIWLKH